MPSKSLSKSGFLSCICDLSENVTTIDLESMHTAEPSSEQSITTSPQHIIDFGIVNIGSRAKQIIRFENIKVDSSSSYILIKDLNSNPIYQAFDFHNTDSTAMKTKSLEQIFTFHPKVPNEKYLDHFYLTHYNTNILTILLKGECRGPRVQLSVASMCFTKRGEFKTFEILNVSEMQVTYQFDVNATNYDIFQVNHPFGTLESKQRKIISITFNPKESGVYSKILACLVLHEEPKIIRLTGFHANKTSQIKDLMHYTQDLSEIAGFGGFMLDSITLLNNIPPFSLSQNFLDFGMVKVDSNKANHKILVTSLTNHMKSPIIVTWTNHDIFKISPREIQIPCDESILYEITFTPNDFDSIFYVDLFGTVNWSDDKMEGMFILIPQNISLRLLGNSFYCNDTWIPQLEMKPESIVFPCCVPTVPSYSSFILKTTGYLPVSFKFIPPSRSNFIIKPMLGFVSSSYQIIYAQFHPFNTESKGYVERWEIELNGRTEVHELSFFMKGYCDYPAIMVGNNNTISFSTMLPGAKEHKSVLLKNTSSHFLQYQFILDADEPRHAHLSIIKKEGDLAANESITTNWFCTGGLNMPKEIKVPYTLRFLQNSCKVVGTEFIGEIIVHASCAETKLCSLPNNMEFDDIQFDCIETVIFKLFNFGEAALHFLLYNDDENNAIDIFPMQGTITANDNITINAILKPVHGGKNKIKIYYQLRKFKDSVELLTPTKYKIFEISYNCKLSCIQIIDIEYHNYGQLFNRLNLWNIMQIDNLNKILLTLAANETKELDIHIPEYREINETYKIYFLLKNVSQFDTNVSIVRKQICNCKLVERKVGISFSKLEYNCIHRKMIHIELENNNLIANCCTTMKITCKYVNPGENVLCYILKMSNGREIVLNIHMQTIGPSENVISIYDKHSEFILRDTFIGELDSFLHTLWVYNNMEHIMQYYLDLSEVNDLQYKNDFPIIECKNPMGYINPCAAYPLIFKFSPLEAVVYRVSIPIIINEENVLVFKITGKGLMHPKGIEIKDRHVFQSSTTHNSIVASVEHISLPPIGQCNEIHWIFFLKNFSKDVTYYYSWQNCGIAGLVEVDFERPKGIINPKETHIIRIVVNTLQHACITTIQMRCKLIDQNAYIEHIRTVAEYQLMQEKIKREFIITELGELQSENTVVIKPMPKVEFLNLSMDVYIVGVTDRDQHMTGQYQMEKFPYSLIKLKAMRASDVIHRKKDGDQNSLSCTKRLDNLARQKYDINETLDTMKTVLQMIVADTIYSKQFDYIMDELKVSMPPYHYQMKINDGEPRKRGAFESRRGKDSDSLLVQVFKQPQMILLGDVMEDLVQNSLLEVFKLGTEMSQTVVDGIVVNITQECVCPKLYKTPEEKGDEGASDT